MGLASSLAMEARAMVDTSACSLKCLNKRMKTPTLKHRIRIVLKIAITLLFYYYFLYFYSAQLSMLSTVH